MMTDVFPYIFLAFGTLSPQLVGHGNRSTSPTLHTTRVSLTFDMQSLLTSIAPFSDRISFIAQKVRILSSAGFPVSIAMSAAVMEKIGAVYGGLPSIGF